MPLRMNECITQTGHLSDISYPTRQRFEALPVGDVEHNDNALRLAVERRGH